MIQEPYFDYLGNSRATSSWVMIKPSSSEQADQPPAQSLILVDKRLNTNFGGSLPLTTETLLAYSSWETMAISL